MTDITRTLKASIDYESSKRHIMNLMNHTTEDLSVMIETITLQIKEHQCLIAETERTIDGAEDMSEVVEKVFRDSIAQKRKRIEDLYAWRVVFLGAWSEANKKNLKNGDS